MLQMKSKLTFLTGAHIQYSSQGAVLGGLHVSAETPVVRVDCRGGQSRWLEGVAVHFNPFQIHALIIPCWHRPKDKQVILRIFKQTTSSSVQLSVTLLCTFCTDSNSWMWFWCWKVLTSSGNWEERPKGRNSQMKMLSFWWLTWADHSQIRADETAPTKLKFSSSPANVWWKEI